MAPPTTWHFAEHYWWSCRVSVPMSSMRLKLLSKNRLRSSLTDGLLSYKTLQHFSNRTLSYPDFSFFRSKTRCLLRKKCLSRFFSLKSIQPSSPLHLSLQITSNSSQWQIFSQNKKREIRRGPVMDDVIFRRNEYRSKKQTIIKIDEIRYSRMNKSGVPRRNPKNGNASKGVNNQPWHSNLLCEYQVHNNKSPRFLSPKPLHVSISSLVPWDTALLPNENTDPLCRLASASTQ